MKLVEKDTPYDSVASTGYRQTRYQDEEGKAGYIKRAIASMIVSQAPEYSKDATTFNTLLNKAKEDPRYASAIENTALMAIAEEVFDEWNDSVHAPKEEPKAEEPKEEVPPPPPPKDETEEETEDESEEEEGEYLKSTKGGITDKEADFIKNLLDKMIRTGLPNWKSSEKWMTTIISKGYQLVEDEKGRNLDLVYDIGFVLTEDFTEDDLKERAPKALEDLIIIPFREEILEDDENAHWEATSKIQMAKGFMRLTITVTKTQNAEQDLEGIQASKKIDANDKSLMQKLCAEAYRSLKELDFISASGKVSKITMRQVTVNGLKDNEAMWRISVYLKETDPRYPDVKLPISVEDVKSIETYFDKAIHESKELSKAQEQYKYTIQVYGSSMSETEPHKGGFYVKLTKEDKNTLGQKVAKNAFKGAQQLFGLKNKGKPTY